MFIIHHLIFILVIAAASQLGKSWLPSLGTRGGPGRAWRGLDFRRSGPPGPAAGSRCAWLGLAWLGLSSVLGLATYP